MARKKRSPGIQLSRRGLFIWIGLVVFIAGWMFVLGIMVGRGVAPVNMEVGKLEKELSDLKAKMLKQEQAKTDARVTGKGDQSPQLGFYEALKSSKKTEPFKSLPRAAVRPKPAPKPTKTSAKSKPLPKSKQVVSPKPKRTTPTTTPPKKVDRKGRFTIQVAASQDIKLAEKLVVSLRKKEFKAYQIRSEVAGKGVWYRVRVGAFENQDTAGKVLAKLKAGGYGGMVVNTK